MNASFNGLSTGLSCILMWPKVIILIGKVKHKGKVSKYFQNNCHYKITFRTQGIENLSCIKSRFPGNFDGLYFDIFSLRKMTAND